MSERDVVDEIKRYAPMSLKVTLRDGTEKAVGVPKSGNRWSRTQQILDALPWVQIECLDKDGKTIGIVEDDEEMDALPDEDHPQAGLARVLLEVMRTTMKEQRLTFDAQLRGQAELLSAMTDGMRVIADSYKLAMQTQATALMSGAAADSNPEMLQMMQMAMTLMNQPKQVTGPKKES